MNVPNQRDLVRESLDRDNQRDVFPMRPPGERRRQHRVSDALDTGMDVCVYCGVEIKDRDNDLRMACPALLGAPLPTHSMRITPERAGWRARLANVERLMSHGLRRHDEGGNHLLRHDEYAELAEALGLVRSMIDGIGGE